MPFDQATIWPNLPVENGVQTNCWRAETIIGLLNYLINMISNLANGAVGSFFNDIFNTIMFIMYQYHSLYYTIEVTEEMIHIKGGPCQWCSDWNNIEDQKRWISAAWCFSSQIMKTDIVSIETRQASLYPDYFPRLYCAPINWCCCHKSYSGFYAPYCCDFCQQIQCGGWCDGDIYPVWGNNYVTFSLSESPTEFLAPRRCTPNLCSGCSYNRISYVLRDPTVVDQLRQAGYTVVETAPVFQTYQAPANTANTATTANTANTGATQTGAGATGATGDAPVGGNSNQQEAPPGYEAQQQQQQQQQAPTGNEQPPQQQEQQQADSQPAQTV